MSIAPKSLYRRYLRHLKLIPDPHIWSELVPTYRKLLEGCHVPKLRDWSTNDCDTSDRVTTVKKLEYDIRHAKENVKKAQKKLDRLRAAVACHPHALKRLLEETYGLKGATRWRLIREICKTSTPSQSTSQKLFLPTALYPLRPAPIQSNTGDTAFRARSRVPDTALRKSTERAWRREWKLVKVPLILPGHSPLISQRKSQINKDIPSSPPTLKDTHSAPGTGWEQGPVIFNLRILSGLNLNLDQDQLNLSKLPTHIRRLFPSPVRVYNIPEPPYPSPPARATRSNPGTWRSPRKLTPRLMERMYRRLWASLVWVKPVFRSGSREDVWVKCSYEEMLASQGLPSSLDDEVPAGIWGEGKMKGARARSAKYEESKWSMASKEEVALFQV